MLNEENIKRALDRRLSGLAASQERRMRIRRAAYQEIREDKPVKNKKMLIVSIALMVVMLTSAIAVAETLNLFDYFSKQDERFAALAPYATLEITEPVLIEHPHLGNVEAKIDSAYFNGEELMLAYRVSNSKYAEEYTPTDAEIAQMTLDEPVILAVVGDEPDCEVMMAYNEAVEKGTPFGYKSYTVYVGDHAYTDDGIDLGPWGGYSDYDENGALYELREYESPLPDNIDGRDTLTVAMKVRQHECTVWFDGKDCWISYSLQDVAEITAVIPRTTE